jgi:hypothetical protein
MYHLQDSQTAKGNIMKTCYMKLEEKKTKQEVLGRNNRILSFDKTQIA